MESLTPASSLYDLRRQSEQLSPHELKDFVQDIKRRPSLLERESETCRCCSMSPRARAYKNVLGAGLSFMLIMSTIVALASLQSSLNDDEGLGLAALAIQNFSFLISGVFSSSVIRLLGTKYCAILSYALTLPFAIANFYPQWYTLVPGIVLFGLVQGPLFASISVHATTIAIKYAPALNEKSDHLIALFAGIITMFFKLAYIPGNAATTIILFSERRNAEMDIIDTSLGDVCNNTEVDELDQRYIYVLLSCFLVLSIIATVIAAFFMDHLGTEVRFLSCSRVLNLYVKNPIVATFKMFADWKIYLLFPMTMLDSFLSSSTLGKLSKFYVSDCIGVHWVGLFSMTYGVSSAIAAVTTGRLVKYIPQFLIVYCFSTILMAVVLFQLFWGREPSYLFVFLPIAIIGSCGGMWHAVPPTLVGILYPDKKEPAYSVLRMALACGYVLGFAIPLFVDIEVILWMEVAFAVISLIAYSILVFITQTKQQIFPCCYLQEKSNTAEMDH